MNRICLFQVCPEDRKLAQYIWYLASKLMKLSSKVVIISNGDLNEFDRQIIINKGLFVFERGDIGYDAGAFKEALEKYLGWETIKSFDELILVNDTCYGPLYPLEDVFDYMDKRNPKLDFWSITQQSEYKESPYKETMTPYHIQPYFCVIRKRMLQSQDIKNYWKRLSFPNNYGEAIADYELKFTEYFNNRGFLSGAYIDSNEFCVSKDERMPYIFFNTYRLLSEGKCPLIKRKSFKYSQDIILSCCSGETVRKTFDFIKENTAFNEKVIIDDLINYLSPRDIYERFHFDFIVEPTRSIGKQCVCIYIDSIKAFNLISKIEDIVGDEIDIYVICKNEHEVSKLKSLNKRNNTYIDSYLNGKIRIETYNYICIIVGNVQNSRFQYGTINDSIFNIIVQNMLGVKEYIGGIEKIFRDNSELQVLLPPSLYLAYNLAPKNDNEKECILKRNAIWMKCDTLQEICKSKDFVKYKVIIDELSKYDERKVDSKNLLFGVIQNAKYASLYLTNLNYMLKGLAERITGSRKESFSYYDLMYINPAVHAFCKMNSQVYIYGAGEYGYHCLRYLIENGIKFMGFIVSDGRGNNNYNENIYELSKVDFHEGDAVIVAIGKEGCSEALKNLAKKKVFNVVTYAGFYERENR